MRFSFWRRKIYLHAPEGGGRKPATYESARCISRYSSEAASWTINGWTAGSVLRAPGSTEGRKRAYYRHLSRRREEIWRRKDAVEIRSLSET